MEEAGGYRVCTVLAVDISDILHSDTPRLLCSGQFSLAACEEASHRKFRLGKVRHRSQRADVCDSSEEVLNEHLG